MIRQDVLMRILLVLLAASVLGGCSGPKPLAPAPRPPSTALLQADPSVVDVGTVFAGEERPFVVGFANRGSQAIPLQKVQGACGCTQLEEHPLVIEAGARMQIKGVLRTTGFQGKVAKEVFVQAQPPSKELVTWEIHAEVKSVADFPTSANLTMTPQGSTYEGEVALVSQARGLLIDRVESTDPDVLKPTAWPKQSLAPGEKGQIRYRLTPVKEGRFKATLVVYLSKPVALKLEHHVHTYVGSL